MIKFRHSIFALPFALAAMLVAAQGFPSLWNLFWIVVACVAARSMAMAYNRLTDREIDATNPRTKARALPARLVTPAFTRGFTIAAAALFVFAAGMLNALCLALSPVVIVVLLGYSHGKRATRWVHLWLGVALGLAPLGAWIAVTGSFTDIPILLALGVACWTAGFDIIYACLDIEHDRREALRSLPVSIGVAPSLRVAAMLHALFVVCLALWIYDARLGFWSAVALALSAALLWFESRQVKPSDLSRVGSAFFTCNAAVSLLILIGCAIDVFRN